VPDGNDEAAPGSPNHPADRSAHPTGRHRDPAPHTPDGDCASTSPTPAGNQDASEDSADGPDELTNRRAGRPSSTPQREAETTGESGDRSSDHSAELSKAASNGQQRSHRDAKRRSGRRRDAAGERKHSAPRRRHRLHDSSDACRDRLGDERSASLPDRDERRERNSNDLRKEAEFGIGIRVGPQH
jgi:hypothetical protein